MIAQADKQRVADAIRAAEAKTMGEIYCVVAQHASRYPLAPFAWAAAFALTIPLWLILFADASAGRIYVVQLAGFVVALALFSLPRLRYHLVPRAIQHARAHLTAMRQFAAQGLHKSKDRTGVLIFAAAAERYATVIADEGIHGKVDPDTWNGAIDILITAIKDGRPADGFVGAVERCGAVLAEHFPRPAGAVKAEELPDKLVEI
jgi:putative membrane protein